MHRSSSLETPSLTGVWSTVVDDLDLKDMKVISGLAYTRMAATFGKLFALSFRYFLPYVLVVRLTFRLTRVALLMGVPLPDRRTSFLGNNMFMVMLTIK